MESVLGNGGSQVTIGKIERLPLRQVWKHEAQGFTTWLEQNIDVLNNTLDLTLSNAEREQDAGDFSVDVVAEDQSGNTVIIENQLEKSNHDHLGKLVTYTSMLEAKAAIWIVAEPRPEHVRAVSWLNEGTSAAFYLVKVEAVRIGDSAPAPLLTLIVGPSEETAEVGTTKRQLVERHHLRRHFWSLLLERAGGRTKLHSSISPSTQGWVSAGAGRAGLAYCYVIAQHGARVELYIDRGKDAEKENAAIFDMLCGKREQIEATFGDALRWEPLEGKRACRIRFDLPGQVGYKDPEEDWPRVQDAMVDSMIRLEAALRPHIEALRT